MKLNKLMTIVTLLVVFLAACVPTSVEPAVEKTAPVVVEKPAAAEEYSDIIQVVGPWLAGEGDAFEIVLDGFREETGIEVVYEGVNDLLGIISTRIAAGSPPDVVILPVANGLKDFIAQGVVIPLDKLSAEIDDNFSSGWIDQYTFDSHIYAIPTRSDLGNCLWYNPSSVGEVPISWSAFTAYCDSIVENGISCTTGIGKDVWTLKILFQSMYLSTFGPENWMALGTGEIPFNDPSVVETFDRITKFYGDEYAAGGGVGTLGTGLMDGIANVFGSDPSALFVQAGSWAGNIAIYAVNPDLAPGETIDYVPFPGEVESAGAMIGSADVAVLLSEKPEAMQLMSFLISTKGQARFSLSSYTVANKNIDPALYDGLSAKTAELLTTSQIMPDIDSFLAAEYVTLLNEAIGAAILDPGSIKMILDNLQANIQH